MDLPSFKSFLAVGEDLGARALQAWFPGITPDVILQGWLPVPQELIEAQLRQLDRVEDARVTCTPGVCRVEVDTRVLLVRTHVTFRLAVREAELSARRRVLVLESLDDVAIGGRNLLGSVAGAVVQAVLASALSATGSAPVTLQAGAVDVAWPRVTVHLDRIEPLAGILSQTLFGYGVTDVVEVGPVEVAARHLRVRVGWAVGVAR